MDVQDCDRDIAVYLSMRRLGFVISSLRFGSTAARWQPIIGLELHVQLATRSKLFSGAPSDASGRAVNDCVSLYDMGTPGTLPMLNRHAVELAIKASLLLNCRLNRRSEFDRKHYFYADLPCGYQITQQRAPIATDGYLDFFVSTIGTSDRMSTPPYERRVGITRIQIEMDSGKSVAADDNRTLVNLNRAGCGLIEIITEPQLHSALEAASFVEDLRMLLVQFGICHGELQKGHLRVDANVSVRPVDSNELGVRTEIKNLNSYRFIRAAIDYEINRQERILDQGGVVVNETRSYDQQGSTISMRDKEVRQDYRFMPEPNLPSLRLDNAHVQTIATLMPVPITHKRRAYIDEFGIDPAFAILIVKHESAMKFVDDCLQCDNRPTVNVLVNAISGQLRVLMTSRKLDYPSQISIAPETFVQIVRMQECAEITALVGFGLMGRYFDGQLSREDEPRKVVETNCLWRISDTDELRALAERCRAEDQATRSEKLKLSKNVINRLVRNLVDMTDKRIDPDDATEAVRYVLQQHNRDCP